MKDKHSRREFLERSAKAGAAFCALCVCGRISPAQESAPTKPGQAAKPIDLKGLAYCGIPFAYCERNCELFKATRDNDAKLKKDVYDQWGMKQKFGVEFDPEKIFCYGCKPGDKPLKVGMAECPVRTCPRAAGLEACVQCMSLESCDKAFWKDWPNAHKSALAIQSRYKAQPGAVLKDGKAGK